MFLFINYEDLGKSTIPSTGIGMIVITSSIVLLVFLQGLVMLKACCLNFDLWELYALQVGTMICLMGILLGFAVILEPSLSSQRQDTTKSSSPS